MVKKIFRNTFITSLFAVIASAFLVLAVLYGQYEKQMLNSLKSELQLIIHGINMSGEEYFKNFDIPYNMRITWVDSEGDVIYDSKAQMEDMDNHGSREEIDEAFQTGQGDAIRYSDTLMERTMYYARLLDDGTVIRIACGNGIISSMLFSMINPIIFILIILCVIMYLVAKYTAKAIVAPINQIDLESGQINHIEGYVEIKPLLARIRRQNILIDTNIKELKHEHEKREVFRREFTANVSHELKTPLTSISGISEMLMNGIIRQEDVPEFAGNINKEAGRLINLVNDIILISKLEDDELHVQKEEVNVFDVALSVKNRLQVIAAKKNVIINVSMINTAGRTFGEGDSGQGVTIIGVYSMIEELLFNLCDNAIKYNRDNGTVDVIIKEMKRQVEIRVEDTGIGIPDEDKKSVFERFYRVDKSRSKEVGGTGLGLSIVKHVAMYHGGNIVVKDREGGGTCMVAVINK